MWLVDVLPEWSLVRVAPFADRARVCRIQSQCCLTCLDGLRKLTRCRICPTERVERCRIAAAGQLDRALVLRDCVSNSALLLARRTEIAVSFSVRRFEREGLLEMTNRLLAPAGL